MFKKISCMSRNGTVKVVKLQHTICKDSSGYIQDETKNINDNIAVNQTEISETINNNGTKFRVNKNSFRSDSSVNSNDSSDYDEVTFAHKSTDTLVEIECPEFLAAPEITSINNSVGHNDNDSKINLRADDINDFDVWTNLIKQIEKKYGAKTVKNWFSQIKPQNIRDNTLILLSPTKFIREFIFANYLDEMLSFVKEFDNNIDFIEIQLSANNENLKVESTSLHKDNNATRNSTRSRSHTRGSADKQHISSLLSTFNDPSIFHTSVINKSFNFENFISDESNGVAYNAVKQMVDYCVPPQLLNNVEHLKQNDKKQKAEDGAISNYVQYVNSLYIYAPVGMGKSHLLQAAANRLTELATHLRVAYFSFEKFTQQYINSVRNNTLADFKNYLSSIDVLLLDDLQLICGRHATEKEFVTAFDSLVQNSKKIIVASDKLPNDLALDERTKSRLNSAVTVMITKPNFETKIKILESKFATICEESVNHEIIELIAMSVDSSIRELEAMLYKIVTHCQLLGKKLSMDVAHELIDNYSTSDDVSIHIKNISLNKRHKISNNSKTGPKLSKKFEDNVIQGLEKKNQKDLYQDSYQYTAKTSKFNLLHEISLQNVNLILSEILEYFGITLDEIISDKKNKKLSLIRQIIAFILKENTSMTLKEIGLVLGGRNYSTVIHMINALKQNIDKPEHDKLRMQLLIIKRKLIKLKLINFY